MAQRETAAAKSAKKKVAKKTTKKAAKKVTKKAAGKTTKKSGGKATKKTAKAAKKTSASKKVAKKSTSSRLASSSKASELMTASVAVVDTDSTLEEAALLMWNQDCGALPVLDEEERVAGMITDRDLCMGSLSQGRAMSAIPVQASMNPLVSSCRAESSLEEIHALMRENRVRRIPVVDEDRRLLGIVGLADLARAAFAGRSASHKKQQLELAITLEAVGRPRSSGI